MIKYGKPIFIEKDGVGSFFGYESTECFCDICGEPCKYNEHWKADVCNWCSDKYEKLLMNASDKICEIADNLREVIADYPFVKNTSEGKIISEVINIIDLYR